MFTLGKQYLSKMWPKNTVTYKYSMRHYSCRMESTRSDRGASSPLSIKRNSCIASHTNRFSDQNDQIAEKWWGTRKLFFVIDHRVNSWKRSDSKPLVIKQMINLVLIELNKRKGGEFHKNVWENLPRWREQNVWSKYSDELPLSNSQSSGNVSDKCGHTHGTIFWKLS